MNLSWLQRWPRPGAGLARLSGRPTPPPRQHTAPPPWIVPGLIRGGRSGHGGHLLLLLLLVTTILVTRSCPAPGPGPCGGWWWS